MTSPITPKEANRMAAKYIMLLPDFKMLELRILAKILGAQQARKIKGGKLKAFNKDELIHSIRSVLGRGSFSNRLVDFANKANEFSQ